MKKIILKAECTILISDPQYFSKNEKASWTVNLCEGIVATIEVSPENLTTITTIKNYSITNNLFSLFRGKKELENYPKLRREEVSKINLALTESTKSVLSLIKYHLDFRELSEQFFSIKSKIWSENGKTWRPLPTTISIHVQGMSISPLGPGQVKLIQKSLHNNVTPLLAMRHLHRAKLEQISHHKWIDATIAAELAVKEVLMRAAPTLETLLIEVPSPPLVKLYGVILEKYLGERSPYLNKIREGVEKRNNLIHRPNEEKINGQEAINYVLNIEKAIFHLLSLLYPGDQLIKYNTSKFK
jgi:hypothetical protein